MKHERFFVDIQDWLQTGEDRKPLDAMDEILSYLGDLEWRSLSKEISNLLNSFLDQQGEVTTIPQRRSPTALPSRNNRNIFVSCVTKEGTLAFIDMERGKRSDEFFYLEFDVFAPDDGSLGSHRDLFIEATMKCFGLTRTKDSLISSPFSEFDYASQLRERLVSTPPIDDALFQRLRDEHDRNMLRELKKRGAILERDLGELVPATADTEATKRTLDYLSGDEYQLVDRKYAIVCNNSGEIILPVRQREDFEKAKSLECPKCERLLGEEQFMAYYGATDALRGLIDGNAWMPLLVRESFLGAGVHSENIHIEVKNGEDEIDVLVFHKRRVIVVEAKNRPVSLNDAYKLSAKRSRIERGANELPARDRYLGDGDDEESFDWLDSELFYSSRMSRSRMVIQCIPVIISTHDISKDARDLLSETTEAAKFLEQSDRKIDGFIRESVAEIDTEVLERRLSQLTSRAVPDSCANSASLQVESSFATWSS